MTQKNDETQGIGLAVLSYLWLFGIIFAYFLNQDKKHLLVRFHIRQSLGIWLSYMMMGYIIGYFDSWTITLSFWIGFGALVLYGAGTALAGQMYPVPLVGRLFQKLFSRL